MATTYLYLSGQAYWTKLYPENCDEYNGEKNAQLELVLDAAQLKALKAHGSKANPRINDEGKMCVKLRRKIEHKIPELGGFPTVLDAEGNPFNKLIGNGSDVTVKVSIYDTPQAKGTRLESVRVDKLVEYKVEDADELKANADTNFLVGVPF